MTGGRYSVQIVTQDGEPEAVTRTVSTWATLIEAQDAAREAASVYEAAYVAIYDRETETYLDEAGR